MLAFFFFRYSLNCRHPLTKTQFLKIQLFLLCDRTPGMGRAQRFLLMACKDLGLPVEKTRRDQQLKRHAEGLV